MNNVWRVPIVIGSLARHGAGAMLAPEWMGGRWAPTLQDHPDPRMNLRGFGGAQTGIALYTLRTARSAQGARAVLSLNGLVDACDAAVSLLERRERGEFDRMVVGGVALNVTALLCWSTAAVALRRTP